MMTPTLLNNRYKVIRVLGSGGFGETFLAEDTQMPSGRRCVIKQLKPVTHNPQVYQLVQERFGREAAILEELGDENNQIPRLYAYFSETGQFYLIQEWIQGQTLSNKLEQEGLLSSSSVKEILLSILPILEYVHSKRIVHRDIKPDNIILRDCDGKPVLIDFGAVRETMGTVLNSQGNTASSIVIGTPGFMSSEQAAGRPMYSSDLYSLGLTAIYLLTGKMPHELEIDPQTGEIIWQRYALSVSPSLAAVLDRAIQSHARDRYPTALAMLDALQSGKAPIPPTVPSPQLPVVSAPLPVTPPQTVPLTPPHSGQGSDQKGIFIGSAIAGSLIGASVIIGFVLARSSQPPLEQRVAEQTISSTPPSSPPTEIPQTVKDAALDPPFADPISPLKTARQAQLTPLNGELQGETVETERVRFRPGATGTTVSGSVASNQRKRYLLRSLEGQQFTVQVVQGDVEIAVVDPSGQILGIVSAGETKWQGQLPSTGDYAVEITSPAGSNYAVTVEVLSGSAIAGSKRSQGETLETERVRFRAGATGATVGGSLAPNQRKRYLLRCLEGQQFTVQVVQGNVNVALIDPAGRILGTANNDATQWQGRLPTTGDYTVEIVSPVGSDYAVRIDVL